MSEEMPDAKPTIGKLYSPTGVPIVGTDELIPGTAYIDEVGLQENGEYKIEFTGYTEEFAELQYTKTRDGEDLYIDENGDQWKESELLFRPERP